MHAAKVNQQFIAEELGLSRATVSRCFTNHPGINPSTRARVFELASQLGYHHMEMRAPTKRRPTVTKKLGVLICTDIEEYFRGEYQSPGKELVAGLSEFAQLGNAHVELHYLNPHERSFADLSYVRAGLSSRRSWDGVVLVYPFPRNVVNDIRLQYPAVSLVEQYGTAEIDAVDVDHRKGIAMMMNRLIGLGHHRIGFFTRKYEPEPQWSYRRFASYVEKLARLGVPLRTEDLVNVYPGSFLSNEQSFEYAAQRVRAGVTAWVCAADHLAFDLIHALQKQGIRVPQDVSITGFDGIEKPASAPELTTAVIPYREIGLIGGRRLMERLNKPFASTQHILLSPKYREGATTAPPSA